MRCRRVSRTVLTLLLLGLVVCGSFWALLPSPVAGARSRAPDFSGAELDGTIVNLQSFHGEPLVLIFWASW